MSVAEGTLGILALCSPVGGSDSEVSAYNAGDPGSIPGSGRSPGEGNSNPLQYSYVFRLPWWLRLKCLPPMRETRVQSLGREESLEKEMTTHSSILAWRIPWTEEPGGLQSTGHKETDMTERLHFHFSLSSFLLKMALILQFFPYEKRKGNFVD